MIKNKAVELVKTFSAEEMKSFELFVRSPFHNSNKILSELVKQMRKNIEKPGKNEITEEILYNKLFPGKPFNYGIMKNLISDLLKLAEKYLIEISAGKYRDFEDGLRLLEEYNNRHLDKLFLSEYNRLHKSLHYSIVYGAYYRNKARLMEALHAFFAIRNLYRKETQAQDPQIIYNTCSIISMMKQNMTSMDYITYQMNFSSDANPAEALKNNFDVKTFLKDIKKLDPEHYTHISLEIMMILLYTEPGNEENYFSLKKIVAENITKYSNPDKWHLTSALVNFLLNGYIKGKKEYFDELADVRKLQIANMKFNTDDIGPLQNGVYRNIAETFIILGDIDFAENFINEWLCEIEEDKRLSTHSYCMALVEEARGNNEKVLEYLLKIEQTDYQTKFSSKMLGLIAFYNLGLIEQGLSSVDSFKHFIRDTAEFSEDMKSNFSKRVRLMEKLFKIKANPEKYSLNDVNEIESTADIFNHSRREWFLNKVDELRTLIIS